mmetsp:Transcript_3815/g.5931  ORF Transcript_3815/g.5931 Transcript_3815/m.5931 type:complete len:451 (-) Transcript_3815:188-1540(-)
MSTSAGILDPRAHASGAGESSMFGSGYIVDPMEAERFVEGIRKFDLEEVGSSAWMRQHEVLEKLNLQAHQSAMTRSDEYILESVLTFGKLEVLIYDLLVIEAWKEYVYPLLVDKLAGRNSMRLYFILYHEATVINLLEVFLYHKHVCESGGEKLLELVDYVARKMTRLNGGYDFSYMDELDTSMTGVSEDSAKEFAESLQHRRPTDDLRRQLTEIEFRICVSACSVARFLCEHSDNLPLSVVSRICDTHDLLMLFIPLIENPPWTRRLPNGKWQKLVDFKWQDVQPIDLLKITRLEGQPWISLYYLMAKQVFRERYHLNSFRKGQILRVRKYLSEVMLDQLPFLVDIQRYMDELAITEVPEPVGGASSNIFMFQQVSVMREGLLKGKEWETVANTQMDTVFTMTDKDDPDLRRMAELYADDAVEGVLEPPIPQEGEEDDLEEISSQLRQS